MAIRLQFEDGTVEKFSTIYKTGNRIFNCWVGYGHNDDEWAQLCGGVGLHPQHEDSFDACSHIACAVKAAKERNGKYDYYNEEFGYGMLAVWTFMTFGLALALLPFVCYSQSKKPERVEKFNDAYPYLLHYQETYDPITGWGIFGDGRRARNISIDEAVQGKSYVGFSHAVFGSSEWNASLVAYKKKGRKPSPDSELPISPHAHSAGNNPSLKNVDPLEFEKLRRLTVIQRAKELAAFASQEAYDRYCSQNRDILEQQNPRANIDHCGPSDHLAVEAQKTSRGPKGGNCEVCSPGGSGSDSYIGMAYFEKFQKTNSSIAAVKKKASRQKKSNSPGKSSLAKTAGKRKPKEIAPAKVPRSECYEVYCPEENEKKEVEEQPKKKGTVRDYRDLFKNN